MLRIEVLKLSSWVLFLIVDLEEIVLNWWDCVWNFFYWIVMKFFLVCYRVCIGIWWVLLSLILMILKLWCCICCCGSCDCCCNLERCGFEFLDFVVEVVLVWMVGFVDEVDVGFYFVGFVFGGLVWFVVICV